MDKSVSDAASVIRTSWLTAQPTSNVVRLPWTGYKRTDEKAFFSALYSIIKGHNGPVCYTQTDNRNLDYPGWFNYFFNEAKAVAKGNTEFETNVGRIASLLFELATEGSGTGANIKFATPLPARLSDEFTKMLASTPGGVPRKILDYRMQMPPYARSNRTFKHRYQEGPDLI
jgi:hypothetical protein